MTAAAYDFIVLAGWLVLVCTFPCAPKRAIAWIADRVARP